MVSEALEGYGQLNTEPLHTDKCNTHKNKVCNCDGYHTFAELYEHRCLLFLALCSAIYPRDRVWHSTQHHDGSMYDDSFIMGIDFAKGKQITYHLPLKFWNMAPGYCIDKAPEFDNHTSDDVLNRLKDLIEDHELPF